MTKNEININLTLCDKSNKELTPSIIKVLQKIQTASPSPVSLTLDRYFKIVGDESDLSKIKKSLCTLVNHTKKKEPNKAKISKVKVEDLGDMYITVESKHGDNNIGNIVRVIFEPDFIESVYLFETEGWEANHSFILNELQDHVILGEKVEEIQSMGDMELIQYHNTVSMDCILGTSPGQEYSDLLEKAIASELLRRIQDKS